MTTIEQVSQLGSEEGEILQLETRRSAPETYRAFYDLYGQDDFQDDLTGRESTTKLVSGRALHFDDSGDASTHLIVREYDDVHFYPSRRHFTNGQPAHYFPYDTDSLLVATTDGDTIERWTVEQIYGVHPGRIDGIANPYQATKEHLHVSVISADQQERRTLIFNRATGDGTMVLENGRVGWILSEKDTERQKKRIFGTAEDIGRIATAS